MEEGQSLFVRRIVSIQIYHCSILQMPNSTMVSPQGYAAYLCIQIPGYIFNKVSRQGKLTDRA